jgi:hypothetical protein
MSKVIVIEEVKYGTNAGQGMTASGKGGFDIWITYEDNFMHFLGFIKHEELVNTVMYYEDLGDRVEIRYLPHE